jgi:hypothetical protein
MLTEATLQAIKNVTINVNFDTVEELFKIGTKVGHLRKKQVDEHRGGSREIERAKIVY